MYPAGATVPRTPTGEITHLSGNAAASATTEGAQASLAGTVIIPVQDDRETVIVLVGQQMVNAPLTLSRPIAPGAGPPVQGRGGVCPPGTVEEVAGPNRAAAALEMTASGKDGPDRTPVTLFVRTSPRSPRTSKPRTSTLR